MHIRHHGDVPEHDRQSRHILQLALRRILDHNASRPCLDRDAAFGLEQIVTRHDRIPLTLPADRRLPVARRSQTYRLANERLLSTGFARPRKRDDGDGVSFVSLADSRTK